MMITPVGVAYMFRMLTDTSKGPFTPIWQAMGLTDFSWVNNAWGARTAILIADVWQWTPFMFLVIYSGLGAVPPEPVEAAKTLGASDWQIFRRITLPSIKPVILIALIIRALEAFKIFDLIFIMTGGGPGSSTESISLYLYRTAFTFGRLSFASAAAVLVLLFVAAVSWLLVRPLRTDTELT